MIFASNILIIHILRLEGIMKRGLMGKKFRLLTRLGIFCLVFVLSGLVFAQSDRPKVVVVPGEATVELDSSVQFTAFLKYKDGTTASAAFTWSLQGQNVGILSSTGLFTATAYGKSQVSRGVLFRLPGRCAACFPGVSGSSEFPAARQ